MFMSLFCTIYILCSFILFLLTLSMIWSTSIFGSVPAYMHACICIHASRTTQAHWHGEPCNELTVDQAGVQLAVIFCGIKGDQRRKMWRRTLWSSISVRGTTCVSRKAWNISEQQLKAHYVMEPPPLYPADIILTTDCSIFTCFPFVLHNTWTRS